MIKRALLVFLFLICFYVFLGISSLDKQYFICPIEYKNDLIVRHDYRGNGAFASNRSGRRVHKGLDLLAKVGTPVCAAKSGKVISATQNPGMGKYIIVRHRDGMITIYGHLSGIFIQKGDYVRQGMVIGSVGKTGNAAAAGMLPHLHFEIRKNGVPQDPLEYI
jgi:murein DD-endopeptidase MepM/ murein hydrolase activator NlpD